MTTQTLERSAVAGPQDRPASGGRWILLVTMAATFMAVMDSFIVNVAVPSLRADLHASFPQTEWAVGGYTLTYGLLLVTGGRLGDLYGPRRLFAGGIALFTAASLGAGLAAGAGQLIAFRVAQAAGAALFYPQVLAVLRTSFAEGRARSRAFAVFGAVIGLASIAGQVVGGLLISLDLFGLGWRSVFLVNLPIGIAAVAGALRVLPRPVRPAARGALDLPGVALLSAALLALTGPLTAAGDAGWSPWTVAALVCCPLFLAAFAVRERRAARPLVDPALLGQPAFSGGLAVALAFFAGNAGLFFVLALELQSVLGLGPLAAGLAFAPLAVAFAAASLCGPRLTARLGRHTLTLGYTVNAFGTLALLLTCRLAGDGLSAGLLVPALAVIGAGQGLGVSPLVSTVLERIPERQAGAAAGVLQTANQVGMALGVGALGLVFGPSADGTAFRTALWANLALAVLALALLPLMFRGRPGGGQR